MRLGFNSYNEIRLFYEYRSKNNFGLIYTPDKFHTGEMI